MRPPTAGPPAGRRRRLGAFQHHVAEVQRRPLALGVGEVPLADVGQGRGGAVGVLQLVDANGDLILAGLEDDRQFDARVVVRAAGVEDVQSELDGVLARVEDVDAQGGEGLPVLDLGDAVADGVALEESDLEGLAAEFLEVLDEFRLGFVVGADFGEGLPLADVEQVGL